MTTLERLEEWKALGIISAPQHATLASLVRRERFSLFVELNGLLYIGVISLVAGLGWTFKDNLENLGDAAIFAMLSLVMAAAFGYCVTKAAPYSHEQTASPTLIYDYVLYFGCLMFAWTLGFAESRFGVFQGWDTHLLLAALVFGGLAYRFDNRFVLSLSLSTLAGFLGLKLSIFDAPSFDVIRFAAFGYGAFLLGVGAALHRLNIKRHFFDVYLQLGANAILLAAISGILEPGTGWLYLVVLLVMSAVSIVLGVRYRRFAFVAYGTLYGYAGLSVRFLAELSDVATGLFYFVVTGTAVVIALVVLARRFGRDE